MKKGILAIIILTVTIGVVVGVGYLVYSGVQLVRSLPDSIARAVPDEQNNNQEEVPSPTPTQPPSPPPKVTYTNIPEATVKALIFASDATTTATLNLIDERSTGQEAEATAYILHSSDAIHIHLVALLPQLPIGHTYQAYLVKNFDTGEYISLSSLRETTAQYELIFSALPIDGDDYNRIVITSKTPLESPPGHLLLEGTVE